MRSLLKMPPHILFIFVVVLTGYPIVMIVVGTFWSAPPGAIGHFTLDNLRDVFLNASTYKLLSTSVYIATFKTIIAVGFGLFLAYVLHRTDIPYKPFFQTVVAIPFFVPTLLKSLGYIILANPNNGLINKWLASLGIGVTVNIYTAEGIIFVMSLHSIAFSYILFQGPVEGLNASYEEAARISGASRYFALTRITIPLLAPILLGVGLLSFVRGLESFDAAVVLGTPGGVYVFANKIYEVLRVLTPARYGTAMALAVFLIIIVTIFMLLLRKLQANKDYVTITGKGESKKFMALGKWKWPVMGIICMYILLSVIMPIGLLVYSSFFKVFGLFNAELFTFSNYTNLFKSSLVLRAMRNTPLLVVGTAMSTTLIGVLVSYILVKTRYKFRLALEWFCWLPWAIPGIVLGLAILWGYIKIPGTSISLYGTVWILVVAYTIMGLPLAVREMSASYAQIDDDLPKSARVCGAGWITSFVKIDLPLLSNAFLATSLLLVFIFIRELSAAVLLYSYGNEVLSVAVLDLWEQGRGNLVAALSTLILIAITLLVFVQKIVSSRIHAE